MKKQYMDFVPSGGAGKTASSGAARGAERAVKAPRSASAAKTPTKRVVTRAASTGAASAAARKATSVGATSATGARRVATKSVNAGSFSTEKKLGAIEAVSPKFVRTDVPKRPLSRGGHFVTAKTGVAAAKAQKIGGRSATAARSKPVEKPVENSKRRVATGTYQTPRTPFINQGKVAKRPLSKNIYVKKVETPKEEPQGPVTIISKPEKQAHVGMVVTIILTIILGAAAGTVAFLLLPK